MAASYRLRLLCISMAGLVNSMGPAFCVEYRPGADFSFPKGNGLLPWTWFLLFRFLLFPVFFHREDLFLPYDGRQAGR